MDWQTTIVGCIITYKIKIYDNVLNIGIKLFVWEDYNLDFYHPNHITLSFDNQWTIMLLASLKFHSKDKHIDIQYHFIREEVQMKEKKLVTFVLQLWQWISQWKALGSGSMNIVMILWGWEFNPWRCRNNTKKRDLKPSLCLMRV